MLNEPFSEEQNVLVEKIIKVTVSQNLQLWYTLLHPYLVKKPLFSTENNVYNILQDAQRMQEHMKKKKGEVINYMEEKGISLEEYKVSIMYVHDNYHMSFVLW